MITFPEWSDLGLGSIQDTTRMGWDYELSQLNRRQYYFDGLVFNEKVELDQPVDETTPLMFPIGMNLVKMLCLSQADATFGEWEHQPIQFSVREGRIATDPEEQAIEILNQILESSNAQSMLWELELDRNVFGGGVLKIVPDNTVPGHIKWVRVPRGSFFPIWDPDNPDNILEAYLVVAMTAEQAQAKYGFSFDQLGSKQIVRRVEHWTQHIYENRIEDIPIPAYSGRNPWGVVPFVFSPRLRFDNYYGDALTDDVVPVQDDLNARVADIGEAINYNAHPTRWGINLPRNFTAENFPIGPNAMWDLGRAISNSPKPEVGLLEAESAVSQGAFEYVQFLYDWSRTSSFAPPIAFGEDQGGGQRSGITLEIRMWPLIKATRRSRGYLATTIKQAIRISAAILSQKEHGDIPKRAISSLLAGDVVPTFYNLLPRDQQAVVDEVVKLLSTNPPSISETTAQMILGRGIGEVDRIKEMINDEELWVEEKEEEPVPTSEQTSEANDE